jgi:probable HAF family extracellular repeat protein
MKLTIPIGFVLLLVTVASAQDYTITDLGDLSPAAINTWGQVVGNYNSQAYIWSFGHKQALGLLPGGTFSWAAAINDLGTVAGTADGPGQILEYGETIQCNDLIQPFIWTQQKKMRALGTVGPASDAAGDEDYGCPYPFYAAAINNRGQVVGYTGQLTDDFQWVFLWTNGGMSIFGSSLTNTYGNGISNSGEIAGENGYNLYGGYATYWKNGTATELVGLTGFSQFAWSAANGVNDLGQIAGWSTPYDASGIHAVLWSPSGAISDLGTLPGDTNSSASKINLFGLVIGSSGDTVVNSTAVLGGHDSGFDIGPLEVIGRPFIWSALNGMRDLNTLIHPNSGWVLNTAADINVWGQIVGSGTLNGQPRGFLLTPRGFSQ